MTRQEKFVVFALLAALLLGTVVRHLRRGGGNLNHPSLNTGIKSP
jgi:hypothetical protein